MILPVFQLTLRALLLQRRTLLLALVVCAPVLTGLVFGLAHPPDAHVQRFYSRLMQDMFVPAIGALVALVFGVSAFGDEREDGTILYLVATPQPRLELVIAKVAAAWTATMALLAPSLVLTGLFVLGGDVTLSLIVWPLIGVTLASLAYCAASAWLSLLTRRPVVIGIIYLLLWEGSIATYATSAQKLSISAYGRVFVAHVLPQGAVPVTGMAAAIVVLAIVIAGASWGTARSLATADLP